MLGPLAETQKLGRMQRRLSQRFAGSDDAVRGRNFQLIPFGSGRRSCPGMKLGLAVVQLVFAHLVLRLVASKWNVAIWIGYDRGVWSCNVLFLHVLINEIEFLSCWRSQLCSFEVLKICRRVKENVQVLKHWFYALVAQLGSALINIWTCCSRDSPFQLKSSRSCPPKAVLTFDRKENFPTAGIFTLCF